MKVDLSYCNTPLVQVQQIMENGQLGTQSTYYSTAINLGKMGNELFLDSRNRMNQHNGIEAKKNT
jgi:hypothetical protein